MTYPFVRSTTERLDAIFGTRLVTIGLKPLNEHAITELVMHTLHISPEAAAPLVSSLIKHSNGNAFNIRSLLMLLKNEDYVDFFLFISLRAKFSRLFARLYFRGP